MSQKNKPKERLKVKANLEPTIKIWDDELDYYHVLATAQLQDTGSGEFVNNHRIIKVNQVQWEANEKAMKRSPAFEPFLGFRKTRVIHNPTIKEEKAAKKVKVNKDDELKSLRKRYETEFKTAPDENTTIEELRNLFN